MSKDNLLRRFHKKDNELTERYLGRSIISPGFWARKTLEAAIKEAASYVEGRVLDAGCGNKPYKKYFDRKASLYIGLDYSKNSGYMGNMADVYADVKKLPFKDNSFDSIVCFEVLEHIDDTDGLMLEFKRVLKKRGRILISSPFAFPIHSEGVDYFRFTGKGLRHALEKHGFSVLKIMPVCGTASTIAVLFNTYVYYGCFFWNKFLYPFSIILRPLLWALILFVNVMAWMLDKAFKVDFLPFGHLVIAELC